MRHIAFLLVTAALAGATLGAAAADKVLRYAFPIAETGFDPAELSDLYSSNLVDNIFDAPLKYDYLARPVKLLPNTLTAMPEITFVAGPVREAEAISFTGRYLYSV